MPRGFCHVRRAFSFQRETAGAVTNKLALEFPIWSPFNLRTLGGSQSIAECDLRHSLPGGSAMRCNMDNAGENNEKPAGANGIRENRSRKSNMKPQQKPANTAAEIGQHGDRVQGQPRPYFGRQEPEFGEGGPFGRQQDDSSTGGQVGAHGPMENTSGTVPTRGYPSGKGPGESKRTKTSTP